MRRWSDGVARLALAATDFAVRRGGDPRDELGAIIYASLVGWCCSNCPLPISRRR